MSELLADLLHHPRVNRNARVTDIVPLSVVGVDQALDLRIGPDRQWQWKDLEEFERFTGHPMYWNEAQAARIRASGDELVRLAEAGRFPFDGTWCGYRPDAGWTVPGLPAGADRPRAVPTPRDPRT